jgi:hypothetical protein
MSTTMLYRKGASVNAEAFNLPLDTVIVADIDIEGATAEGWLDAVSAIASLDGASPYAEILDGTVKEIESLFDAMSADELRDMRVAEEGGKTRSGLIAAIDKAIAAKEA